MKQYKQYAVAICDLLEGTNKIVFTCAENELDALYNGVNEEQEFSTAATLEEALMNYANGEMLCDVKEVPGGEG